ncbi:MAG: hypothetical protein A3A33_00100 [Candidatus Yanofskybacteria bacterium RIFCSPLOWO2_01_FULL_49_25]|uniref:UPF0102 protein A3A33_00100 n=1 Tax=Candidatus Yanofskybacteria bacterium RIFCSPLOWO2_01_FULL_49_25 TaxID=1802701 RepID=A0A1F8GWM5_9BACT|nr:MAG: hypothetical protein A3A33_00100 [Candidatus Yanofskybacteria bacterium RIFCSPLOWO2_01_FULL_49_25]
MNSKEFGYFAENIAGRHLESKGYTTVERNYQKPWGEIDIIMRDGSVVVFVEVKANMREYPDGFSPEIRVDERKLSALIKTAMLYMEYEAKDMEAEWRIDIVSVTINEIAQSAKIKHYKNIAEAFS